MYKPSVEDFCYPHVQAGGFAQLLCENWVSNFVQNSGLCPTFMQELGVKALSYLPVEAECGGFVLPSSTSWV